MIMPPSFLCTNVQELGQTDKAKQYAATASRRRAAIAQLMAVQDRPGVWTDLVVVTACGESCTGNQQPTAVCRWNVSRGPLEPHKCMPWRSFPLA